MTGSTAQPPTWAELGERAPRQVDATSPAAELAALLQRFRDDLDQAARAGAASRLDGLRGLAEQAVLAVELERLLERHRPEAGDVSAERTHIALGQLKDRMLANVAASGLEVVRLGGATMRDVAGVAEVDSWRYDDANETPVVVEELAPAVRLDGVPLRRGRVVVRGRHDASPTTPAAEPGDGHPDRHATRPASERPRPPRIVCPISGCRAENHAGAQACVGCLVPLAGFTRLLLHREALFARGVRAARLGDSAAARECFAAIVLWHPHDIATRNAYALACLDAGDIDAARSAWREVLARAPGDAVGLRGLAALPTARRGRARRRIPPAA